jgi:hypothetical protein
VSLKRSGYSSSYAPRKDTASKLTYDSYPFKRISWLVDAKGNIATIHGTTTETVLVSKNWRSDDDGGGYLADGLWKYAFQVSQPHNHARF